MTNLIHTYLMHYVLMYVAKVDYRGAAAPKNLSMPAM